MALPVTIELGPVSDRGTASVCIDGAAIDVIVPTQIFTSSILPCHKDVVMDRVYEAGRRLRAKEIRLDEYFDLLNVAQANWWLVVMN